MKVTVTQDHIDNGVPCKLSACPIALAIACQLLSENKGIAKILVLPSRARVNDKLYHMPTEATAFVNRFDNGVIVQPIEFEMEPYQ